MNTDLLTEKIKELTPEEQEQVLKFIDEIILSKNDSKSTTYHPTFSWAGGLAHIKDEYTSIELQKKSLEWMAGDI
jgi:hypothetical protein